MTASTQTQTASEALSQRQVVLGLVQEYLDMLTAADAVYREKQAEAWLLDNPDSGDELAASMANYFAQPMSTYSIDEGKRYLKVVATSPRGGGRSVHAFVDRMTGEVYKSAGWSKPAKGVRFNLSDPQSKVRMFAALAAPSGIFGGYLYR